MKKNKLRIIIAITVIMVTLIAMIFTACEQPVSGGTKPLDLSGTVSISPNDNVETGTLLTANYSGNETITEWQWKQVDSDIVLETGINFTPNAAGTYTVTASAEGFKSKTSDAVSVTAKVEGPIITITFDSTGGTEVDPITVAAGTTITLPAAPTKEDYIFTHWLLDGQRYTAEQSYTANEAVSFSAQWGIAYSVYYYNANFDSPSPPSETVAENTVITLPEAPLRDGFVFSGWRDGNYSGDPIYPAGANFTVTINTYFYAQWKMIYSVTFDADGGTPEPQSEDVVSGTVIKAPVPPSKPGFTFVGWKQEYYDQIYSPGESITITGPSSFTAIWISSYTEAFVEQLEDLPKGDADNPSTVVLAAGTFTNAASVTNGLIGWSEIHNAVLNAKKYVVLDLSACSFVGNTITGNYIGEKNDMNIIVDSQYVKGIILPNDLESIGDYAFAICVELESVIIGDNVTSISDSAFYMENPNYGIKSVVIGSGIETIQAGTFSYNGLLTSVTFKESNVNIGDLAFPYKSGANLGTDTLKTLYESENGGAGTYTRTEGKDDWTKQQP
jgi:uncharacterized repeat protein (TIGR02543 family)